MFREVHQCKQVFAMNFLKSFVFLAIVLTVQSRTETHLRFSRQFVVNHHVTFKDTCDLNALLLGRDHRVPRLISTNKSYLVITILNSGGLEAHYFYKTSLIK